MSFETLKFGLGAIVFVVVLWQALKYLGRFLSWVERTEIARQKAEEDAARRKAAVAPAGAGSARVVEASEPENIPADHVVAIAAAVAAYGYKIVHIADATTGHAWAAEGRLLHQTSHRTH